jgi:phosphoenolpyruvate---glycerone phosphotransferase subunit DhaL
MNAQTITRWMQESASAIGESRDYLTQLDAAIGDADHGANMDRGFTAVVSALDGLGDQPPGKVLIAAGRTLISNVGGASGPLWGSALRGAGKQLGDQPEFGPGDLADALDAGLAAVVELGAAEEGDKTMVDALAPAVRAYRAGLDGDVGDALDSATAAAEEGMRATTPMQARKGRASYLGERSVGHQDPGATSAALIVAALDRAVRAEG